MTSLATSTATPQKKRYQCGACGAMLTHREARQHWEVLCPQRPMAQVCGG